MLGEICTLPRISHHGSLLTLPSRISWCGNNMLHVTRDGSLGALGDCFSFRRTHLLRSLYRFSKCPASCHSFLAAWVRTWHITTSVFSLRDAATINMTAPETGGDLGIAESSAQQNACTHRRLLQRPGRKCSVKVWGMEKHKETRRRPEGG